MTESDWKLYGSRLIGWRDRYVERVNRELIIALADVTSGTIDRFWNTHEQINAEARLLRQCFDGSTRETMIHHLLAMLGGGIIDQSDLDGFSDAVRNILIGEADVPYEEPAEFSEDEDEYESDDE